jgi:hypothetical protein
MISFKNPDGKVKAASSATHKNSPTKEENMKNIRASLIATLNGGPGTLVAGYVPKLDPIYVDDFWTKPGYLKTDEDLRGPLRFAERRTFFHGSLSGILILDNSFGSQVTL